MSVAEILELVKALAGCVIKMLELMLVQLFASVTVHVYVPEGRLLMFCVVAPLLQLNEKGVAEPLIKRSMAPSFPSKQLTKVLLLPVIDKSLPAFIIVNSGVVKVQPELSVMVQV